MVGMECCTKICRPTEETEVVHLKNTFPQSQKLKAYTVSVVQTQSKTGSFKPKGLWVSKLNHLTSATAVALRILSRKKP